MGSFPIKDWHNEVEIADTPLNEDALEDMELRLSDYTGTFGANVELAYDERAYGYTAGASANEQVINDLSVTVEVTNRPIKIIFGGGSLSFSAEGGVGTINIKEGSTHLAGVTYQTPSDPSADTLTTLITPVRVEVPRYTTTGTHTFTVSIYPTSGNMVLSSGVPAVGVQPIYLQVLQI